MADYDSKAILGAQLQSMAEGIATDLKARVQVFTKGNELTDWNTLADTGLYIVNTSNTVANEPERGKVACYVTNIDGYISQLAVGDKVYMRFKRALEPSWQPWVVLQDSSGTTASELYSSTQGGYFSIASAALETANSTGTTSIAGGTTTISDNNSAHTTTITPEHVVVGTKYGLTIIEPGVVSVNGLELNTKVDVTAAIPASSNEKLKNITHLLVNGNKTLKLSEMIENKAYVFHVVSSGAVVSVYNDDTSAFTIKHRGTDVSVAESSSSSLNSSTDPAGEIWLARVGRNIYMSKSCEDGVVSKAASADITKTSSATNGDTLQIGNGNAVTIGNAAKSNKAKYSDGGKKLDEANWLFRYVTLSPVMIQNGGTVVWMQCPSINNTTFFVIGHRNNDYDDNGGICPAPTKRLVEIDFYVDIMFPFNSLQDHWQTFAFRAKTESSYNRTESFAQNDSSYFAEARVSTWVKGKYIESGDAETTIHVRLVGYLDDVGTSKSIVVGCRSLFGVGSVGITPYYQIKGYNYNVLCSSLEGQRTY